MASSSGLGRQTTNVVITLTLVATVAGSIYHARDYLFEGNLHAVIPGRVYRSAAPDLDDLRQWIDELGLRAVVNLRSRAESASVRIQQSIAEPMGAKVYGVRLSARRWPTRSELGSLVAAIEAAPRPVLLHCRSGTERTGLAATLVLLLDGQGLDDSRRQFALRYGYPGRLLGSDLPGLFDVYEAWLAERGWRHSPDRIRQWVKFFYAPPTRNASGGRWVS